MNKKSLYNMVCAALCDYETAQEAGVEDAILSMYEALELVQRYFDEIENPDNEPLTNFD